MFANKFKSTISMILVILILFSMIACSGNKAEESDTTQDSKAPETVAEQTDDSNEDNKHITLYQNKTAYFNMVFDHTMDMTLPRYTAAKDFCAQLCTIFGETMGASTAPKLMSDADYVENQEQIEILWGKTACKESVQVYEEIGLNEYGFRIIGNKVVIYGNTLDELKIGAEALRIQLNENAALDDNGNVVVKLSNTAKKHYSTKDLAILSLPTPTVGTNVLFCDDGDDARMWVVEGCKMADFDTYTAELMKAGFELYSKNNDMNGSAATAENKNKSATYTKGDIIADVWYTIDGHLRITASRGFDLPEKTVPSYSKVAETGLTIVGPSQVVERGEMLMFFRLADGSFFVIDGGVGNYMWDNLYAELEKQAPDKNNIRIRCWMFTHSHGDHTGAFTGLAKKINSFKDKVTVESFMYNFSGIEQADVPNQNLATRDNSLRNIFTRNFANAKKYKVHPGNEFDFANMHLEVLSTHENGIENQYPMARNDCNISVKIEIENQTIILMGDTGFVNQEMLGDVYGDYLKCDILQAAHHGYDKGGIVETNLLHQPEVVLFMANWEDATYPMKTFINKDFNQALVNTAQNPNFKEYICHDGVVTYLPLPYTHGSKVITTYTS